MTNCQPGLWPLNGKACRPVLKKKHMQNRINDLFREKNKNILSVYFTAGYPNLGDTATIIRLLEKHGTDLIEVGMPFSDPTADGPTIQSSSDHALKNGMSIDILFDQLSDIRSHVKIPLVLMGYINPVLQYGMERFCRQCNRIGIDGIILPDLPPDEYILNYQEVFKANNLHNIYLITPQTSDSRILEIDKLSTGFIYMVSSSSTTGAGRKVSDFSREYFSRVKNLNLQHPQVIGFGISDRETFENACMYALGAIIGSAFVKALQQPLPLEDIIRNFVGSITGQEGQVD
jgi:tryptophan synthase alpha chain